MLKKISFLLSLLLVSFSVFSEIAFPTDLSKPITFPPVVPASTIQKPAVIKRQVKVLDKIAALVNDDIIMQSELDQKMDLMRKQLQHNGAPLTDPKILRQKVLDNIIDVNLQLQIAKKSGLTVSDSEVLKVITGIAQKNHMTLASFQEALAHDGISYAAFQQQIHDQMLVSKLAQQVLSKNIIISARELMDYQKTHKMNTNSPTAKRSAQEAIYQLKMQESFQKWIKNLRSSAYIKIMTE